MLDVLSSPNLLLVINFRLIKATILVTIQCVYTHTSFCFRNALTEI